jgi:predicted CoA-substrate-specific enzyme activase
MKKMEIEIPDDLQIKGVCTTGSGRELIGAMVGADVIKNEISAHARAAVELHPDVRTIFEIGGQDSKVTIIEDGTVIDFAMNLVCAAGTGSFLDSQARRLDITIQDMSKKSVLSVNPTSIAGRCTVFAESDMIHKQQIGHAQEDILMGLCHALARNFIGNVCRGKELKPPYLLQGGVSANGGIKRAFEEALNHEVIIPKHNMVMGAYGAALLAADGNIEKTNFRGMSVGDEQVKTRAFVCSDCSNNCEIIEIINEENVLGRTGGRCGKW